MRIDEILEQLEIAKKEWGNVEVKIETNDLYEDIKDVFRVDLSVTGEENIVAVVLDEEIEDSW